MTSLLSLFLLSTAPVMADSYGCTECCRLEGLAGCPSRIRVFGDGSLATPEGGGWRVIGVWWLDCETGSRFESAGTVVIADEPRPGDVLRLASPPATVRCFAKECLLPAGGCIEERSAGRFVLAGCSDGQPLRAEQMLVVKTHGGAVGSTAPTEQGESIIRSAPPESIELPAFPEAGCFSVPILREESDRQVAAGRGVWQKGELSGAVQAFQVALSIDSCNPEAWIALGQTAYWLGQAGEAVEALRVGVQLDQDDVSAWTALGAAFEAQGQNSDATDAYRRAIGLEPTHQAAREGLERVQGRD